MAEGLSGNENGSRDETVVAEIKVKERSGKRTVDKYIHLVQTPDGFQVGRSERSTHQHMGYFSTEKRRLEVRPDQQVEAWSVEAGDMEVKDIKGGNRLLDQVIVMEGDKEKGRVLAADMLAALSTCREIEIKSLMSDKAVVCLLQDPIEANPSPKLIVFAGQDGIKASSHWRATVGLIIQKLAEMESLNGLLESHGLASALGRFRAEKYPLDKEDLKVGLAQIFGKTVERTHRRPDQEGVVANIPFRLTEDFTDEDVKRLAYLVSERLKDNVDYRRVQLAREKQKKSAYVGPVTEATQEMGMTEEEAEAIMGNNLFGSRAIKEMERLLNGQSFAKVVEFVYSNERIPFSADDMRVALANGEVLIYRPSMMRINNSPMKITRSQLLEQFRQYDPTNRLDARLVSDIAMETVRSTVDVRRIDHESPRWVFVKKRPVQGTSGGTRQEQTTLLEGYKAHLRDGGATGLNVKARNVTEIAWDTMLCWLVGGLNMLDGGSEAAEYDSPWQRHRFQMSFGKSGLVLKEIDSDYTSRRLGVRPQRSV